MTPTDLLIALLKTTDLTEATATVANAEAHFGDRARWKPVGGKDNNRGPIEAASDPGRALVERITNAVDAVLEREHGEHHGNPDCRSPREAAAAWLNVPAKGGLAKMTKNARRDLAQRVAVTIHAGDGKERRTADVRDHGVGIATPRFKDTILSLNEGNKINKHYLAGAYGQGGSSTLASSQLTLIVSRAAEADTVGFTVVRYEDLDPDQFKVGHYVYLTLDDEVLAAALGDFEQGTLARHYGYDLSGYSSNFGERSVYGLLNKVLFDPVLPVWLENRALSKVQRRTIKGTRNALAGARDDDDDDIAAQLDAPTDERLTQEMFYVPIDDYGSIGVEYWVLPPPTKDTKVPTAAFVNPNKPIVLSLLGQNQGELPIGLVRKDAELPHLALRLVGHIQCESLTSAARRSLFVANREDARRGALYERIRGEFLKVLKSDTRLSALNDRARERAAKDEDEDAQQRIRTEVAKLLRLQGVPVSEAVAGRPTKDGQRERPAHPRPSRGQPTPIPENDPPTFVRFVGGEDDAISFYPGQRRYVRVETDAPARFHDAADAAKSRFNFIASGVVVRGSTPIQGGRLRLIVDAPSDAAVGSSASLRIELSVPGRPTLSADRRIEVVKAPEVAANEAQPSVPPFKALIVRTQDEALAHSLPWDSLENTASSARMEAQELRIFYSAEFPAFREKFLAYERRDATLASTFKTRYEIWLSVHSLLLYQDQQGAVAKAGGEDGEDDERVEQAERRRLARLAAMMAQREVEQSGTAAKVGDDQ